MTTFEITQVIIGIVGTGAVFVTLIGLFIQLRVQARAVSRQAHGQTYEVYQRLSKRYADLLWQACDYPVLNEVWEPLPETRQTALTEAQETRKWGAWYEMTNDEKKCYRYTRVALELFEQAHEIHELGWIQQDVWEKWRNWMLIWCETRFYPFVFPDAKPRLTRDFVDFLETTTANREPSP